MTASAPASRPVAPAPWLPAGTEAVVVGASAGGVEALLAICAALPAGFRPPVLVVLHLPPNRPTALPALLGQHCALPVVEAVDKQPVVPGTVVVAPPDYHLLVEPTATLALSADAPILFSRPAIDPLFETAALLWRERLLAILLTGASTDGSAGVVAVRRLGGQAWIQHPDDARAPLMPESALRQAGADAVLSLGDICLALRRSAAGAPGL